MWLTNCPIVLTKKDETLCIRKNNFRNEEGDFVNISFKNISDIFKSN